MSRKCTVCREAIPAKRLSAVPNATACVPCLEAAGDVQMVRRYDESTKDGMVETYFTVNQYAEQGLRRQNNVVPSNAAFDQAVGDDSSLKRERGAGIGVDPYELIDEELDKAKETKRLLANAKSNAERYKIFSTRSGHVTDRRIVESARLMSTAARILGKELQAAS